MFFATEDVFTAGRPADTVDANIVRVRAAAGPVDYFILEQVVSARLFHPTVQTTTIFHADCCGCWAKAKSPTKAKTSLVDDGINSFHFKVEKEKGILTSGVFRDPFDIGWQSLNIEIVAVEIGTLFLAEIWRSCRAFLRIARSIRHENN